MRLLHGVARTHASFDDPNLVSRAGLVPVMALVQRAGLAGLAEAHVRPGGPCGVNAPVIAATRLRGGTANSARGAARCAAGTIAAAREAGAAG